MENDTGSGAPAQGPADPADLADLASPAGAVEPANAAGQPAVPVPATGEPRVDAALRRLADLDGLPVAEHPPVFERIHGELVEVLGELHSGADSASRGGQAG